MAIKKREIVSTEDINRVAELRSKGYTRKQIAEAMCTTFARVKYIISFLPKDKMINEKRIWHTNERRTFTDTMPNPFPKWWCDKHGYDHDFYRPNWKR